MSKGGIIGLLTALGFMAQFASGQLEPECNPLHATCQPNEAWSKDDYYIDFTKQSGPPSEWTIGSSEAVKFTSNGAEFSYSKKGDAPNMWTDFYMLGGRYDIEMKIASGQGVISSATLWSDTQDEIDYDFSGNQFGQTPFPPKDGVWTVETNLFAQGKMWDGAATRQKDSYKPADQFHKYSVEWDESHIHWFVDDKIVRQVHPKDTPAGFTFPQSPMKLNLGIWGAGEPGNDARTIQWAGGEIDMKGAPYTLYVKSVNITNKYPACQYKYQDNTGKISSIEKVTDGCDLPNAELRKRDYSMSPPASTATEAESSPATIVSSPSTGYPTSDGYPTYPASELTSSHSYSSYSLAQSSEVSPASPSASGHSTASSADEYPTYPASSPSAKSSSSLEGYPTSDAESPSSSHLSASSVHPASSAGPSSAAAHSSAASVSESYATYPAASVSSDSHLSSFVESASSTASGPVKFSESSSGGYPVSPPASSVHPSSPSSSDGYPMSSPASSSRGILSSLSSLILGTSSTASVVSSSSVAKDTSSTASLTASGSIPVSSAGTGAVGSSGSSNSPGQNSGYPTSSPSVAQSGASSSATESTNEYSMSSGSPTSIRGDITSTVYSTNIYTVTSCAPTVTNCPVGKVTTELVSLSTTISSATEAESKPATSSAINSASTLIQPSSSAKPSSVSSEVGSTVKTGASSQSYSVSAPASSPLTMPSTYSVSSEITTSIMSTVYSTNVVTITSCAPSVTNCPVGKVTTETKSLYTTICPVTQTVLDGTTYGGSETAKEVPPTGGLSYSMSSFHPTSIESSASPSSSILSHSSGLVNSASAGSSVISSSSAQPVASSGSSVGISSSVPGSSSGYLMSSPVVSVGASSSMLSSSVVVQNSTASTPGSLPAVSSLTYSASGPASSSSALPVATESSVQTQPISSYATQGTITASSRALTTSTVYTSSIYTISSCKPGEAECSSKIGSVTTETVPLYTTVCPVGETETAKAESTTSQAVSVSLGKSSATPAVSSYGASSVSSYPVESGPSQAASSHTTPAQSDATSAPSYAASAPSYTTSTIYSTNIYTVTSCAPDVTNCPAKGSVTTEVVAVSTTVCPVAENSKGVPGSSVPVAGGSQYTTAAITFSNTLSGSVIVVTSTISFVDTPRPTSYYPTQGAGTTNSAGTAAVGSSAHVTKPGTTITLGTYFTSFIEYDTITQQPPVSVSSGAVPTSYYTGSTATAEVPSYQMSQASSIVGVGSSSVPVAAGAPSSHPAAPYVPGGSSYPMSPDTDETTTLTSSLTNTHTVTQTHPGKQASTCACDQPTVYVTVTSTVQPPFPSSYPTGTAPASASAQGADTYPTSKPAGGIRRWLRRGHGHGEHGH